MLENVKCSPAKDDDNLVACRKAAVLGPGVCPTEDGLESWTATCKRAEVSTRRQTANGVLRTQ